jgi:hypothetical protein
MDIVGTWKRAVFAVIMAGALMSGSAQAQSVTGPIAGQPVLLLGNFDLAPLGYVEEEYFLSGNAVSYKPAGALSSDGHWSVEAGPQAAYTTRLVVVRPTDPAKFNGTVIAEWLNVSAGTDGAPDWNYAHREMMRSGYAYVGISVQKVGIEGGGMMDVPGMLPIKKADPVRYARLNHPGDAFAFDIYTQAARAIRSGAGSLLGPLVAKHVLATGESQSAGFLTTYVNAIQPVSKAFDGFLIHSRFGSGAPLDGVQALSSMSTSAADQKIRTDMAEPVLMFISETDLMTPMFGYLRARQPDNAHLRTWEVAGTAHADSYTIGASMIDSGLESIDALAKALMPSQNVMGMPVSKPVNSAPQHHYVMNAALSALNKWIVTGVAPAEGQRLAVTDEALPQLVLDANGNATGGIRSPWVDVPTARLSGLGQDAAGFGFLFGVTEPYDAAKLAELYPGGKSDYLKKFQGALRAAIRAGFILPSDEAEIEGIAAASFPGSQ